MKECKKCGTTYSDNAKFCGKCGGNLIDAPGNASNEQDRLGDELVRPKHELPKPSHSNGSKPWLWVVAVLFVIGGLGIMAKTCGEEKQPAMPVDEDSTSLIKENREVLPLNLKFETTQYAKQTKNCSLLIDFPVNGNPDLVRCIRTYINRILQDNLGGDRYDGDLSDGEQMLAYFFNRESSIEGNNLDAEVKVYHSTDKYVSMYYYIREYEEGYGPGTNEAGGATFRQSDGSIVSWDDFDNNPRMQQLIYQKLLTLTNQAIPDINPLPKNPPVLYTDEVLFFYTNSELDLPRANERPIFAIPFSDITGVMKPSVRGLIE